MIELKNISLLSKEKEEVLKDINLKFNKTGLIIFKGKFVDRQPLLKILAGYIKPTSGEFFLNDKPLNYNKQINLDNYRFKNVSTALRENNFFEFLTVRENFKLLNFYSRNIKEEDILQVLNFLEIDPKVLDLKSRALSKQEQQLLALSKPLLLKNNIIIVENPLKYLDNEEEVKVVSKILEKISKEKLLFIFTNKDSDLDNIADQIINLKDKTIENIKYNNKPTYQNEDIDKNYILSKPLFVSKVSFFLTKFNLVRNIILIILLSLSISLLSVSISTRFIEKNDKSIYNTLKKDKDDYLYLLPNVDEFKQETKFEFSPKNTKEDIKLLKENSFKRYYLSNTPMYNNTIKSLPLLTNSLIEIPKNQYTDLEQLLDTNFKNSRLPKQDSNENVIEFAVNYNTAYELAKTFTREKDEEFYTITQRSIQIRVRQFGTQTNKILKLVGVFKRGTTLPDGIYTAENQFEKLGIKDENRDFYSSQFYINSFKYNEELQDTEKINSKFNKLSGKRVFTKKARTISQDEFDKNFNFVTTKQNPYNFDGDMSKLNLKDDEVIVSLNVYNSFVQKDKIQYVNKTFKNNVYDNLKLDLTISLSTLEPVSKEFHKLNLKNMKVVGVITPKNSNKFNFKTDPDKENYFNDFVLLSDNNVNKLSTNLNKPIEYFINKKIISYELFSKNFDYAQDFSKDTLSFTSKLFNNSSFNLIIDGTTGISVLKIYIPIAVISLFIAVIISYKLTKGRLNKKVNLFSMFWTAGRSSKILKFSYSLHLLILFSVSFILSIIFSYLFMFILDRLAAYHNGIYIPNLYIFNYITIITVLSLTTLVYILFTIQNTLLINKKVLTSDKDFL